MAQERRTYLLKLSQDEEGQLRIELRQTDMNKPHYFASLKKLTQHLEAVFTLKENTPKETPDVWDSRS